MHADCSARMADLTASLAPTPLDLQRSSLAGLLPDMSSQAMALLQAQQQLAAMQAQVDPMTPMTVPHPQARV